MDNVEVPPDPMYNNFANLDDVFNWIADNALNNRTYRIVLGRNIEMQHMNILNNNSVNNRTGLTIILEGDSKERILTVSFDYLQHFELRFGSTNAFILGKNITLDGANRGGVCSYYNTAGLK